MKKSRSNKSPQAPLNYSPPSKSRKCAKPLGPLNRAKVTVAAVAVIAAVKTAAVKAAARARAPKVAYRSRN